MTPEEIHDMICAQIQAEVDKLTYGPAQTVEQTVESYAHALQEYVNEEMKKNGDPSRVDVEAKFDQERGDMEIIVTNHFPVYVLYGEIVMDEPKEDAYAQ